MSSVSYSFTVRPAWRSPGASDRRTRPFGDAMCAHQVGNLAVDAKLRIFEVHRFDAVAGTGTTIRVAATVSSAE